MDERINKALGLLEPAGKLFLRYSQSDKNEINEKEKNDFVTKADKEIELFISKSIVENFPNDFIIQEEHGNIQGKSLYTWVIDPIDGTNNYVRKILDARIQIALLYENEIILGIIYNPVSGDVYIAKKNKGAQIINFKNSFIKKLSVSSKPIEKSLVIYTAGIASGEGLVKKIFNNLLGKVGAIRIYGSAAMAFELIASGRAECFICNISKPMDMAAGALIVNEAGGKTSNFSGNSWSLDMKDILVSNGSNYRDFLSLVSL